MPTLILQKAQSASRPLLIWAPWALRNASLLLSLPKGWLTLSSNCGQGLGLKTPLRILVRQPLKTLSGDVNAGEASAWSGGLGSGNERLSFVWTIATRRDKSVVGWLFIDIRWAVGLIPNKDTKRKRGRSRHIRTRPHKKELASDFTAFCSQY